MTEILGLAYAFGIFTILASLDKAMDALLLPHQAVRIRGLLEIWWLKISEIQMLELARLIQ
jgi:hypothetical protein